MKKILAILIVIFLPLQVGAVFTLESESSRSACVTNVSTVSISPTAGNALVVFITQTGVTTRDYSVRDNVQGTYGWRQAIKPPWNNAGTYVFYKDNVPSGVTTITVSASGSTSCEAIAAEFSGFGSGMISETSDYYEDTVNQDAHTSSLLGVSSINEVLAIGSGVLNGGATDTTVGSGYTEIGAGTNTQTLHQYQYFASGVSGETGDWSSTGTDRGADSVVVLLSRVDYASAVDNGDVDFNWSLGSDVIMKDNTQTCNDQSQVRYTWVMGKPTTVLNAGANCTIVVVSGDVIQDNFWDDL